MKIQTPVDTIYINLILFCFRKVQVYIFVFRLHVKYSIKMIFCWQQILDKKNWFQNSCEGKEKRYNKIPQRELKIKQPLSTLLFMTIYIFLHLVACSNVYLCNMSRLSVLQPIYTKPLCRLFLTILLAFSTPCEFHFFFFLRLLF